MDALTVMRKWNPHAVAGTEAGCHVFLEDVRDSDGRWYRVEYKCGQAGDRAEAFVRYNPWGANTFDLLKSHLSPDGWLCLGPASRRNESGYDLDYVVPKARFWCDVYSYLREHGYEATCAAVPEWRQTA